MELRLAFRTLLEAYKAVIEVVRMNNKLEDFMMTICEKLFEFCVTYKRKQELKKICYEFHSYISKIINVNQGIHPKTTYTIDI